MSESPQTFRVRLTDAFILDMKEMIGCLTEKLPDERARAYFEKAGEHLAVSADGFYEVDKNFFYASLYLIDWTLAGHGMRLSAPLSYLSDEDVKDIVDVVTRLNPGFKQYEDQTKAYETLCQSWMQEFSALEDFYLDGELRPRFDHPDAPLVQEDEPLAVVDIEVKSWHIVAALVVAGALIAYLLR